MQRRTAVSRLAATMAGLSLVEIPDLEATVRGDDEPFSVTATNLAQSSGTVTCSICQEMADALELTPVGLCLSCADGNPAVRARPHSNPFWTLSPRQVRRLEPEIQRLAARLNRMNQDLAELRQQQVADGSDVYDRATEAVRGEWQALQRELHLLHLLRAASRQFRS